MKNLTIKLFNKEYSIFLFALVVILFFRAITLEYGDLLDPTETRYATIAQNMVLSGDWITPRLPTDNGLELYFSKPPMHFWLTAISYKIFGIDEWTSRLPSFLALLLIISSLMLFARNFFNKELGYIAGIITATSPLMFFLSGSSTIDVSFGAFIFAALVSFSLAVKKQELMLKPQAYSLLFFVFTAFAFLTKGPLALILIGMPLVLFCLFEKNFDSLKSLSYVSGTIVFSTIIIPWFFLVEQANPGSVWYFFYNENFLRYLTKEYGGKYGAAHIRPYGSIWWMLAISIMPWTFYLMQDLWNKIKNFKKYNLQTMNRWVFFTLSCGLSSMIFFSIGRSILPAYTIPGIPGLALYLAYLLDPAKQKESLIYNLKLCPSKLGISLAMFMVISLYFVAPIVETRKSAAEMIEHITEKTKNKKPTIALVMTNNYSPYWISGAHEEELTKPVNIVYATQREVASAKYRNIIIRDKNIPNLFLKDDTKYKRIATIGHWHWYRRLGKKMEVFA